MSRPKKITAKNKAKAVEMRQGGETINAISAKLRVSPSTVKRLVQGTCKRPKNEVFPHYTNGRIAKPVPNQRLILVDVEGKIRVAMKRPYLNYPVGAPVTLEVIDPEHSRIV